MKKLRILALTFALTIMAFFLSDAFQVRGGLKGVKDKGSVCPLCSDIFYGLFSV